MDQFAAPFGGTGPEFKFVQDGSAVVVVGRGAKIFRVNRAVRCERGVKTYTGPRQDRGQPSLLPSLLAVLAH